MEQGRLVDDQTTTPTKSHGPYLVGLDGLRAFAVVAVLLYHAGYPFVGGYLGVESFFVLSGFLITTLLMADQQRHGRIRLGNFWLRRARRLLPALVAMLLGTVVLCTLLSPGELGPLAGDSLAALLYVMNWKLIIAQQSYFDALSRPSLLQHLWSLAIEEQFYLVWPLVCAAGLRWLRPKGFLVAVLAIAGASAVLMAVWYNAGGDTSRLYYGTDTRASGLLIGAALALIWTQERRQVVNPRRDAMLEAAGIGGFVLMLAAYVWLHEQNPWLYLGGFPVLALATAAVVAGATAPGARLLPKLLELPFLRWIGHRSYSLYLWHWPIFLLISPDILGPWSWWSLDLLRFGLTVLFSAASYRFVEQPIRTHGFAGAWALLRGTPLRAHLRAMAGSARALPAIGAALAVVAGGSAMAWQAALPQPVAQRQNLAGPTQVAEAAPGAPTAPPVAPTTQSTTAPDPTPDATAPPTPTPLPGLDTALTNDLQAMLDDTVRNGFVPGVQLTVSRPGLAPWSAASGLAEREGQRPLSPDTPMRIASSSKMFTAVVVLQLVEEGQIALDDPVANWLPDQIPRGTRITVRQLLQHTSGIYDYLEDRALLGEMQRDTRYEWTPQELIDYTARFPQGSIGRWDYSSTNYVALGMLVEQVSGQPLGQQMHQRIFEPLGMESAVFLPQDDVPDDMAHGYSYENDLTPSSMSFAFGTANLAMTTDDLARFGRALFAEELLRPETRELMLGSMVSGRGQYGMPNLAYGLGVMENRLPIGDAADGQTRAADADLVFGHIGGFGGFRSALWYAPDSGTLIAIELNQAQTDPNDLAAEVLDRVLVAYNQ